MQNTRDPSTLSTDIAIIGGGVAGSSLASALASAGLDVVLVEREAHFRDRVRGESIHPWGVTHIEALGLGGVLRTAGAQVLPYVRSYVQRIPEPAFRWDTIEPGLPSEWSIYHPVLQSALLNHARLCGVRILRPARVTRLTRMSDVRLEVATGETNYEVRTRLVIGADGRQSATRRWVGAKAIHDPVHHLVGGCLLEGVALADDTFHRAYFEGGMVLIFPQGGGRARSYIIAKEPIVGPLRGHRHVNEYIELCAAVFPEGMLDDARAAGPLAFFPNADVWSDLLYNDRVVLIGDAAGANDPSGGQGLSLCFRDAREVRDLLLGEQDWEAAMTAYAARRMTYYGVLREYERWLAPLRTDVGEQADARRAHAERAKQADPTLGGFQLLLAHGPDGLIVNDAARRHFLGEDLDDATEMIVQPGPADVRA